jgi:hypothetical protein
LVSENRINKRKATLVVFSTAPTAGAKSKTGFAYMNHERHQSSNVQHKQDKNANM